MSDSLNPAERALLERMFTGEWTPAAEDTAAAILQRVPEERMRIEAWKAAAARVDDAARGRIDADALYRAFLDRVKEVGARSAEEEVSHASLQELRQSQLMRRHATPIAGERRSARKWILKTAIAVGGCCAALAVLMLERSHSDMPGITHTYVTADGQRANITLDDGSQVLLAPASRLRLVDFGARTRVMELDGEAYFTVAHAEAAPFIVRSGQVTTRVLGTTFLVRHPVGAARVHVAVETGRVHVTEASSNSGVTLSAGQTGDVIDSTLHVNSTQDPAVNAEWMKGQVVFRHTTVETILQTLSRWYGYQFRYADPALAQRHVTIGISTKSSAEALAEVEEVLAVNLTVAGDTVTLVPQPSGTVRGTPRVRTYDMWTPMREVGR